MAARPAVGKPTCAHLDCRFLAPCPALGILCIRPYVHVNAFAASLSSACAGTASPLAINFETFALHAHIAVHVGRLPLVLLGDFVIGLQCPFVCLVLVPDVVYALVAPLGVTVFAKMFCPLFLAPVAWTQIV